MKRSIYLTYTLSTLLLLSGCMGYKMGGGHPKGIETVFLKAVTNGTKEPAIELQVEKALRERIQMDGRVKLLNHPEQADAIIQVNLTKYRKAAIAYRRDLKTAAKEYRIQISGTSTLTEGNTGQTLAHSVTHGEAIFEFESDMTTSKRKALPTAARELAKFTVDDLLEQW